MADAFYDNVPAVIQYMENDLIEIFKTVFDYQHQFQHQHQHQRQFQFQIRIRLDWFSSSIPSRCRILNNLIYRFS
jgi:hypothetical protein